MNIKETLKNFNELVMFKHSVFSLPFIFIAMFVAANGFFGWKLLFLALIEAISARNFAMSYNRLVDQDIDALNPRTKNRPSVDGRISKPLQIFFIVVNALLFIMTAFVINKVAFYLSFPILFLLAFYSHFKRFSPYAHLFLGLTLALAPLAGSIAVSGSVYLWTWLLSFGVMFWVGGFDLLYSLQDMEFDQKAGLFSIPSIYGVRTTLLVAKIFHFVTIIFWTLFAFAINGGFFTFLAVFLSAVALYYEHKIVEKSINNINKAFFTINGYLGIMFFILVVIDIFTR